MARKTALALLALAATGLAAPARQEAQAEPKRMPGNDEWYRPPQGFESAPLGAILKYRESKGISLDNKKSVKMAGAWQFLFRTQDSVGVPEATVVSVAVPFNADKKKLFLYHWFADASFQDCNPSLAMQPGTRKDNEYTQLQSAALVMGLNQGWITAVVDDTGPQGVFTSGLHGGRTTLDGIRAVLNTANITGIDKDPIITLYGYSGGAFAGEWAAEMQPTYAPELKIAGMALGGLIPNITALLDDPESTYRSGYALPTLIGLSKDYKNLSDWLEINLKPETKEKFFKADAQCYDSNWEDFTGKKIGSFLKNGHSSLYEAVPSSVFKGTGQMGWYGTPQMPMYIYESVGDDASPVALADYVVKKHCDNGARITYERTTKMLNHSQEMLEGMPGAMRWVQDRMLGKPVLDGCSNATRSEPSIRADKQGLTYTGLIGIALSYAGLNTGPGSAKNWLTKFPARRLVDPARRYM